MGSKHDAYKSTVNLDGMLQLKLIIHSLPIMFNALKFLTILNHSQYLVE